MLQYLFSHLKYLKKICLNELGYINRKCYTTFKIELINNFLQKASLGIMGWTSFWRNELGLPKLTTTMRNHYQRANYKYTNFKHQYHLILKYFKSETLIIIAGTGIIIVNWIEK